MKVYPINLETEEVEEPRLVRVDIEDTVKVLKTKLSSIFNMDVNDIKVVLEMYGHELKYLDTDDTVIKFDANSRDQKLYTSNSIDDDPEKNFQNSKLRRVIEHFGYIITVNVVLPETDVGKKQTITTVKRFLFNMSFHVLFLATLEFLSIPSLDLNQNLDKLDLACGDRGSNSPGLRVSPQPCLGDGFGDQSNSEDSSLSDSDRTLVGEAPGNYLIF